MEAADAVGMDDVWAVAPGRRGGVELTLVAGPPRPLVARLTRAEFDRVGALLPEVAGAVRRGEFSRVRLGAAFREAIGRDPFRQAGGRDRDGLFPWWLDLTYAVVGVGFAARRDAWWLQLAGYAFAGLALADLAGQTWRAARRR